MSTFLRASVWSNLPCNSGVMLAPLPEIERYTLPDKLGVQDQRLELSVRATSPGLSSVVSGRVIVTVGPDGSTERDWWIATIDETSDDDTVSITALSVDACLAWSGVIRQTTGGITTALIGEEVREFVDWLDQRFVPNLADDGLSWITGFGVNDATDDNVVDIIPITVNNMTRGQLLKALTDATGTTAVWARNGRVSYGIAFYETPGSTATRVRLGTDAQVAKLTRTRDGLAAYTAVEPTGLAAGGAESNLFGNAWTIVSISGAGPYTIELVDPTGPAGTGPVLEAHQFGAAAGGIDAKLRLIDGSLITIADAQITPSNAVIVASVGALVAGDRVGIVAPTGVPIRRLLSPSAETALGRRRVLNFPTGIAYGHRNWAENALFDTWTDSTTPARWSASGTMNVRKYPTVTPKTFTATVNGALSAATTVVADAATTDGALFDGDNVTINGSTRTVSGNWYADGSGNITFDITAAITAPDNSAIVFSGSSFRPDPTEFSSDAQTNAMQLVSASSTAYPPVYGHAHRQSTPVSVQYLAGLATLHAAAGFTLYNKSGSAKGNLDGGGSVTDDLGSIASGSGRILPSLMIVRTDTSTALATATVPLQLADGTASNQTVQCSTTLTADRTCAVGIVGLGNLFTNTLRAYCEWVSLWLAASDEIPPPWEGSRATKIWRFGNKRLALALNDERYAVQLRTLDGQTIVLGGPATVYDRVLGIKADVRIVGITWRSDNPDVPLLEIAARTGDLTSLLAPL